MARKTVTVEDVRGEFEKCKGLLGENAQLMGSPGDPGKCLLLWETGGTKHGGQYGCQALRSNLAFLAEVAAGRSFSDSDVSDEDVSQAAE